MKPLSNKPQAVRRATLSPRQARALKSLDHAVTYLGHQWDESLYEDKGVGMATMLLMERASQIYFGKG
jgi:hypothetical protein